MNRDARLPVSGLLALAMTGFIAIMTETLPAGLLPQISDGLYVSPSMAGQMVTLYALGSLVAAIPLTVATRGWRRRSALLSSAIGFLLFNSLTTFSTDYTLTLVARFFAGASAGLAWGLIAGYARRMVAPALQGRAMTLAMIGTPLALSLGVPLGTWIGSWVGWRSAFGIMSVLTLLLIGWILAKVPDFPGEARQKQLSLYQVWLLPGVRPVLMVIFTWITAHNILYTYIVPFLTPLGLAGQTDSILLLFGLSALLGIGLTGFLVDRWLRRSVIFSLAIFALTTLAFGSVAQIAPVFYCAIFAWGATFGGAATLLQTACADAAGDSADIAQSMIVVAWNLAIAGGGIAGGVLLKSQGAGAFPWAMLLLLTIGLVIAFSARKTGFTPGARQSETV
ncbi:MFS transporter [Rouxiella silvae]|uniref:MFS transporter n=1 Tax=Rouxiella silvae TaxID=1646373 RepID=A0AA41BWD8_9GAMM|nr:MFS transporter [Rouxiella silvae]MBF6636912.1 MFS transporter [Rouxiella silvae]ORJ22240.1 MFS transporter [Rouxiella silvae]